MAVDRRCRHEDCELGEMVRSRNDSTKGDIMAGAAKIIELPPTIHEFAPPLCTEVKERIFRAVQQMLGDLCGFDIKCFDLENVCQIMAATEVSTDNNAFMHSIHQPSPCIG